MPVLNGGVAQLGEHLPCTQGVIGSIPFTSTNFSANAEKLPAVAAEAQAKALGEGWQFDLFFDNCI